MDLEFEIENQRLRKKDKQFTVQKSNNYLRIIIDFLTEDWIDLQKFVILRNNKRESYQFYYTEDGVIVPSVVLEGRQFYITVYGADETTKRITSNELGIILAKTGYTKDISSVTDESEDVFVQIFEALDTKADTEDLSTVAFTGDYDDLSNKPPIDTEAIGNEIKYSYMQLKNAIRSKGGQ